MASPEPNAVVAEAVREARERLRADDPDGAVARLGRVETEGLEAADWIAVGRVYREAERREAARTAGKRALALDSRNRAALELASTPYLVDGNDHWVPLIAANARAWDRLGRIAVILGIVSTVLLAVIAPLQPPQVGVKNAPMFLPKPGMESFFTIAFYVGISVYGLSWLVFDVMNRRGRFAWIVFFPIFFLLGIPWVALLVYRVMQPRLVVAKRPTSA